MIREAYSTSSSLILRRWALSLFSLTEKRRATSGWIKPHDYLTTDNLRVITSELPYILATGILHKIFIIIIYFTSIQTKKQ